MRKALPPWLSSDVRENGLKGSKMDPLIFNLLTTVLGAFITGIFGIINTIIVLRAKRRQQEKGGFRKRLPYMSLIVIFAVLIGVGAVIGFYIGNVTKEAPSIVRFYNYEKQRTISIERIAEIEHQIHEIELKRDLIIQQRTIPEPEREEVIRSYNVRIDQLAMEKAEYKEIAGPENKERRIQNLQKEIELNKGRQREAESKINHLMPHIEADPDARREIERLKGKIILLQKERDDMQRELSRLREHH